jgi:hypothetical protein
MSHIFFSIRTLLFAFLMLASSLIVRPMIGDPGVPGRVDVPAADVIVEEPSAEKVDIPAEAEDVDYVSLADQADLVFVGRIICADEADRDYEVKVQVGLKDAEAGEQFVVQVPAGDRSGTLQKLAGRPDREVFFFLSKVSESKYSLLDGRSAFAVEGGKLAVGAQSEAVSAKMLARDIARESGRD